MVVKLNIKVVTATYITKVVIVTYQLIIICFRTKIIINVTS